MDIETILEMYEDDYNPGSTVPGPRNMYNQGQLVQPNANGSRPGYSGQPPSPASIKFITFVKSLDNDVVAESTIDDLITKSGVDIKRDTAMNQLRNNHPDIEYKKTGSGVTDPETKLKIQKISEEKLTTKSKQIKNINDWTDKWYEKNAKKFTSYDDLKTNLINDWAKEVKNKKYSGPFKLSLENGLPNISAATSERSSSLKVANKIFDLNLPVQRANKELIFKKGFANFKLQDPIFKQKINDYFDLIILDKRTQGTQQELIQSGKLKEGYGLTRTTTGDFAASGSKSMKGKLALDALNIDKEVLDFVNTYLKPNSAFFTKTGGENIYDILNKHIDPTKVTNYRNKISMGVDNWRNNLNAVVDLANRDLPPSKQLSSSQLLSQMKNESNKMAKLFGLKDLPPELKFYGYSQDHLLGIREALELGDSKIARQTLKTLVGTTRAQNTFLGFKEFGNKRRKLIKDFNAAPPKARGPIVQKLNDLTKKFIPGQLEYGVKKDGSMKVKVLQPQKTQKSRIESYKIEKSKLPKKTQNLLTELEAHPGGCGKAAGGRILFAEGTPDGKITKCARKGIQAFMDDLKKGNYSKASLNILKGGGNLIKNIVNPMELLRLKNLIGPGAMGFMGLWETGVITDDVIRQGTPLNESLANNWLTKAFLPYTKQYAEAKNLLETGKVPSNMKKYVQDVVTFNESLKDMQGIQGNVDSRLVDDSFGMIDGSSMYSKEKEDKDVNNLIKKMSTISEDVITPGTGKALEMKASLNEMKAARMAKPKIMGEGSYLDEAGMEQFSDGFQYSDGFSPFLGFDKLKDVRTKSPTGIQDYMLDETPKDLRPITEKDYERTELPAAERQYYENKYNIRPRSSLSEYYLPGAKVNVLDELTSKYNMREAAKYPGFFSADSEKFSEGGITTLRSKYEYKK